MQTFGDTFCFVFSLVLQKQEYLRIKSLDINLANIIILSILPLWIKINTVLANQHMIAAPGQVVLSVK